MTIIMISNNNKKNSDDKILISNNNNNEYSKSDGNNVDYHNENNKSKPFLSRSTQTDKRISRNSSASGSHFPQASNTKDFLAVRSSPF